MLARVLEAAAEHDVQAVALVGELSGYTNTREGSRAILKQLGQCRLPAFWVPGARDAPVDDSLREAYNLEVVYPSLHGVHGTAAFAPGYVLFAGFGGHVDDDPDGRREELSELSYPRWEPEYRLKLLREFKDHELVLLFATPPLHKEVGAGSSEVVAELVGTHRPRLVVCGGERGTWKIGRSLVVAPGSVEDGCFAVADLSARDAELHELAVAPVDGSAA